MATSFRKYSVRKDRKAAHRIWQECGWISNDKKETDALEVFIKATDSAWVFDLDGSAEAISLGTPGTFLHTGTEVSLVAITAVTTSRLGRNQGAASGTLARLLAEQATAGVQLSGLGIFEQGFYDRLGYGNGTYETWIRFDPAWLRDMGKPRVPVRLGPEDWKEIHEARLLRRKKHGATNLTPAEVTKSELDWHKNPFGLGYREDGKLTHFFVAHGEDVETGPYWVDWMVYQSIDQFGELMGLIRGLGDQVRYFRLREPRDIQVQSLLRKPFQLYSVSAETKNASRVNSIAYWQMRMLDVPACVAAVAAASPVRFNLELTDPISGILPDDSPWPGCGGSYVVEFAESSSAVAGTQEGLPVLKASVNDFTRLWLGAASAEVLAGLGSFDGPPELIAELDQYVKIPIPEPDWDY